MSLKNLCGKAFDELKVDSELKPMLTSSNPTIPILREVFTFDPNSVRCMRSRHPMCRVCRGEEKTLADASKDFKFPVECKDCLYCDTEEEKQRCPYWRDRQTDPA